MKTPAVLIVAAMSFLGIIPAGLAGCEAKGMKASEVFQDRATIEMADAAQAGDAARVQAAARAGANPNAQGKDGATPLAFVLATTVNKRGLAALLASGADPNLPTVNKATPMSLATRAKDPELLRLFLKAGGNPNLHNDEGLPLLGLAARDQRWENVETLLTAGADINAADEGGYTTVMQVALLRQYDHVVWLLNHGADPRPVSKIGDSLPAIVADGALPANHPLYASRNQVIEMLRARGYNIALPPQQH